MTQSPRMSAIETASNYTIGAGISYLLSLYVLPWWGFESSHEAAATVTAIFTVASIIRSYACRRIFNWIG